MKTKVKKLVIVVGMVSLSLLGSLAGSMQAYAAGPSETQTFQEVKTTTYNQQSVKALGQWEQQGSVWKFRSLNSTYIFNSWLESLSELGAYYYVDSDGVMLTNSRTPDGYDVDANGVWRSGIGCTAPSVSGSSTPTSNNKYDDEISPEALDMMERVAANMNHGNLH